jgi:hypothetical protein
MELSWASGTASLLDAVQQLFLPRTGFGGGDDDDDDDDDDNDGDEGDERADEPGHGHARPRPATDSSTDGLQLLLVESLVLLLILVQLCRCTCRMCARQRARHALYGPLPAGAQHDGEDAFGAQKNRRGPSASRRQQQHWHAEHDVHMLPRGGPHRAPGRAQRAAMHAALPDARHSSPWEAAGGVMSV